MEFLDEDTRPRFMFQSGAHTSSPTQTQPYHKPSKPLLFITLSLSSLLFALSLFFLQSEPSRSLLIWLSLSLLIGPFAPLAITGGDVRVGRGEIVEFPVEEIAADEETKKRGSQRRSKARRSEEPAVGPVAVGAYGGASERQSRGGEGNGNGVVVVVEEKEWSEEDIEVLRKQMLKHPVGKPRRWEVVAEAFGGRHKVEGVIKKAKELGEKKVDDSDSYAQFLKKRKPMVDKRVENGDESLVEKGESDGGWSSGEDIALLNALKAFTKDVPMRWEKIAAAVPGKSKAVCMKRVAELKKGFRSAKAAADA